MNKYEYNPKASAKAVLIFMLFWTAIWVVIALVQDEPLGTSGYIGIGAAIAGVNLLVIYLWFLRNWQKLYVDSSQQIVSYDKRFLFPKVYKTPISDVKEIEFAVKAVNFMAKTAKQKDVKSFRGLVKTTLDEKFKSAGSLIEAMQGAHFNVSEPVKGIAAVDGLRLLDQDGGSLLYAEIAPEKELKSFLGFFPTQNMTWSYKIRWR